MVDKHGSGGVTAKVAKPDFDNNDAAARTAPASPAPRKRRTATAPNDDPPVYVHPPVAINDEPASSETIITDEPVADAVETAEPVAPTLPEIPTYSAIEETDPPALEAEEEETVDPVADTGSVSEFLRKTREFYGEDIRAVGRALHINHTYLDAIERGDHAALPGRVYAVGWVRNYAEHLGLDPESIGNRFKAEFTERATRQTLAFPQAQSSESKIPGGAIIVLCMIMLVAAYAGWRFFSSDETVSVTQDVEAPKTDIVLPPAPGPQLEASADPMPALPPAPEPAELASTPPAPDPAPAELELPSIFTGDLLPSAPETLQPADPIRQGALTILTPPAAEPEIVASADGTAEPEIVDEPSVIDPPVFGEENRASARIVIQAAGESWVEVRDTQANNTLLSRVLLPGERYYVADRPGLVLKTGNAGGLAILVDGAETPSLGPSGSVRSRISLDPDALLAGTAYPGTAAPQPTQAPTPEEAAPVAPAALDPAAAAPAAAAPAAPASAFQPAILGLPPGQ